MAVIIVLVDVALIGPIPFQCPFFSTPGAHLQRVLGLMVKASLCALVVAPLGYATTISASAKKNAFQGMFVTKKFYGLFGRKKVYWQFGQKNVLWVVWTCLDITYFRGCLET
ncbi:heavy metal atpase 1 [Artemisia annua]|uniref:Heavy metal atpase 1 n=1 Tax=Artemisia annua TaxID=35608 RepID=A0A2U1KC66_ARTAN|nr:heavy metal atpase 1 [Artemisia annua]